MAGMRLVFGPDDGDAFLAARASLQKRFERWLAAQHPGGVDPAGLAADAGLVLDWKWRYGDGNLGRWRTDDITEFLLDWCPRKLSVSPEDCLPIPGAVLAFLGFLEAEGQLAVGSSPMAALASAVAKAADEFVTAMSDSSKFGLAKSIFASVGADGVDVTDPDVLEGLAAEFNARPEEDRRRVTDGAFAAQGLPPRPQRPRLPPVALPGEAEIADSKAAAPILPLFAAFAQFVGEGRKLTQTGNLTLADARVLVDRLATGDAMDQKIGDRTFKTKSSAELPRLRQVFAWAKKAGVLRVAHGRVIATKRGLSIAANPGSSFDRAIDALMTLGPLSSQRDPEGWLAWPQVVELLDHFAVHLLIGPYLAQCPLPIDDVARIATETVLDAFEFPYLEDSLVARHIGADVTDIMDALELAGMLRRLDIAGADNGDADLGVRRRRHGGNVELTAAGVATTHRLLVEAGYDAPMLSA